MSEVRHLERGVRLRIFPWLLLPETTLLIRDVHAYVYVYIDAHTHTDLRRQILGGRLRGVRLIEFREKVWRLRSDAWIEG